MVAARAERATLASMGPRSMTAEEPLWGDANVAAIVASMGPRSMTAEEAVAHRRVRRCALASMGPRSMTAEELWAAALAAPIGTRFNGAAIDDRGREPSDLFHEQRDRVLQWGRDR